MTLKAVPVPVQTPAVVNLNWNPVDQSANDAFLAQCKRLKLIELSLGFLAQFLIHRRPPHEAGVEYTFLFVTFNASLLTLANLLDGCINGEFRKLLQLDDCWDEVELYYSGIVALIFYSGSFWMVATFIGYLDLSGLANTLSGLVGMVACLVYGYQWWLLYRRRMLERDLRTQNSGHR
ncbi:uncharacterized protein LOC135700816 [Ochlerotatus camptorhynchus]|uniref:uncharacterized protein LOC135700816 n=1 Tax=Ochlerotatus camptorhynchus TaxID=644619 RepID=UPI0031D20A51